MKYQDLVRELRSAGTEQNQKIYRRHGSGSHVWGVSFANLSRLKKSVVSPSGKKGLNHDYAVGLWESRIVDCQTLGSMIADPKEVTSEQLDHWVARIQFYPVSDYFAKLVYNSPYWKVKLNKWSHSSREFVKRAGYTVLAIAALKESDMPDQYFMDFLPGIKGGIHRAKNRAKESMNQALIAIGARSAYLRKKAMEVARDIGEVEIDHGETSCRSYNAAVEIEKIYSRRNIKTR